MIVSKLPQVGTTIFTTMSQLAAECGGVDASASESERRTAMELVRRAFLVVNKEEAKETDE